MILIPGTTPTHTLNLPIDTGTITKLRITYEQFGRTVIEKTEKEVSMSGKKIEVTLTQEDTLKLYENKKVKVQLKALTASGTVVSHKPIVLDVDEVLNKEVLV